MELGNESGGEGPEITSEMIDAFKLLVESLVEVQEPAKPKEVPQPKVEEPKNPTQFDSVESLERVVKKISNPSDNEKIMSCKVTENEDDPGRKNIVIGIGFKDAERAHSVAGASVNRGVMRVNDLPLPSNPEAAIDYPAYTRNSETLLSALVETADRTGCREVIIPAANDNYVTDNLRERRDEEAKRHGWGSVVSNFVKNIFTDKPRQTTEAIYDNPAKERGFKYDKANNVWRLKLKD